MTINTSLPTDRKMFVLEIELENDEFFLMDQDVFGPEFAPELPVAGMLREVARRIEERGIEQRYIKDTNGNIVGSYGYKVEES